MLRAIWLTIQNEARLLIKDPIVLFMLLFAPVVIITVAGYSLGALYGGVASSFRLPVVNHDNGEVSDGIIDALRHQRSISVELLDDSDEARRLVQPSRSHSGRDRNSRGHHRCGRRGPRSSSDTVRRSGQTHRGRRARTSHQRVVPQGQRAGAGDRAKAPRGGRCGVAREPPPLSGEIAQ